MAKTLGADEIIDTKEKDLAKEVLRLTDGKGVESVLDFVASSQTLEADLQAWRGREDSLSSDIGLQVSSRWIQAFGSIPCSFYRGDLRSRVPIYLYGRVVDAVKIVQQGKIKPVVTRTFPLEEAETATR